MEAHDVFDASDAELEAELPRARSEGRVRVAELIEQELEERGLSLRMQVALETLAEAPAAAGERGGAEGAEGECVATGDEDLEARCGGAEVEVGAGLGTGSGRATAEDVLAMLGVTPVASEDLPEWFLRRPGWRPRRAGPRRVKTEVEEQEEREAKARKWLRRRREDRDGGAAVAERLRRASANVRELNVRARTLVRVRAPEQRVAPVPKAQRAAAAVSAATHGVASEGGKDTGLGAGGRVMVGMRAEEEDATSTRAADAKNVHDTKSVNDAENINDAENVNDAEVNVVVEEEDEDRGADVSVEGGDRESNAMAVAAEEDEDEDAEAEAEAEVGAEEVVVRAEKDARRAVDESGYQVMDWMSDSEGSDVEEMADEVKGRVSFWAPQAEGMPPAVPEDGANEPDAEPKSVDGTDGLEEEEDAVEVEEHEVEEDEEVVGPGWMERARVRAEEEREERERESREALEAAMRPSSPPAAWGDDVDVFVPLPAGPVRTHGQNSTVQARPAPAPVPAPVPASTLRPHSRAQSRPGSASVRRGRPAAGGSVSRGVHRTSASLDDAFAVLRYGSPDGKAVGGLVGGVGAQTREPVDGDRHEAYRAMVVRLEAWLSSDERAVEYEMDMDLDAAAKYYRISGSHAEVYELVTGVLNGLERGRGAWREDNSPPEECTLWNVLWTWSKPKVKRSELLTWQRINHFSGAAQLTRKDLLKGHLARRMRRTKGPQVMAETFLLPMEYMAFVEAFTRGKEAAEEAAAAAITSPGGAMAVHNTWILKPVHESRGRGISLFADMGGLSYGDLSVVQKYISDPMLVDGYKFDLRLYVLVNSFHPLEAYVHRLGFARFAADRYDAGVEGLGNLRMHLTNTAVQTAAAAAAAAPCCEVLEGAPGGARTKCDLDHLARLLAGPSGPGGGGEDFWDELWPRAKSVVLESLLAVKDAIPPQGNSFELFGYDVMFDATGRAWLIEVNASPSLEMHSALDHRVKPAVVRDALRLVDPPTFDRAELLRVLKRKAGLNSRAGGRHSAWSTASAQPEDSAAQVEEDLAAILKDGPPRKPGRPPAELHGWDCIASANPSAKGC